MGCWPSGMMRPIARCDNGRTRFASAEARMEAAQEKIQHYELLESNLDEAILVAGRAPGGGDGGEGEGGVVGAVAGDGRGERKRGVVGGEGGRWVGTGRHPVYPPPVRGPSSVCACPCCPGCVSMYPWAL